jgi:hypothetical protein
MDFLDQLASQVMYAPPLEPVLTALLPRRATRSQEIDQPGYIPETSASVRLLPTNSRSPLPTNSRSPLDKQVKDQLRVS